MLFIYLLLIQNQPSRNVILKKITNSSIFVNKIEFYQKYTFQKMLITMSL
jgi:hypothetical protein